MKFKVSMINELGNYYEETVISNNDKEAQTNLQTYNPQLKVIE